MSSLTCVFCRHGNPAGAKYCNECAAPLTLRPCPKCEAVNDRSAARCYKCGGALLADGATAETAPATGEGAPLVQAGPLVEPSSSPYPSPSVRVAVRTPSEGTGVRALVNPVEFFERSPGATAKRLSAGPGSEVQTATTEIPRPFARRNTRLRFGLLTIVVIGCALMAYFAYRFPSTLDARGAGTQTAGAPADPATVRATPIKASGEGSTGLPVLPAPLASPPGAADHEATPNANRRVAESEDTATPTSARAPEAPDDAAAASPGAESVRSAAAASGVLRAPPPASMQPSHAPGLTMPTDAGDAARFAVTPTLRSHREDAPGPTPVCTSDIAALALCDPSAEREGT